MDHADDDLHAQMLEAFLAIEPQDEHVRERRRVKADAAAPLVAQSVAEHRKINNATGVPETFDTGSEADVTTTKYVDNPPTEFAQFKAEIATEGAARAGKILAQVNLTSLVGGFARFYGNEAEQRACARYKGLWDASQVGGARAVDPSREPVDGGWLNPEAVFENGADARKLLVRIHDHLKSEDTKRLQFVVIKEWGPTPYAKWRYNMRYPDGRTVSRGKVEIRGIAANLAAFLELTTEGKGAKVRADGDVPHEIDPGLIVTRAA